MAGPKLPRRPEPQPLPGVDEGDDVYFQHADGPCSGRVVACGKHGATIHASGKHHRVTWDKVLGHKRRASRDMSIVEDGEDGMILADQRGRRRYVRIPPDAREDTIMVKSGNGRRLLFLKAEGGIKNRPGLALQEKTDKLGRQSKHWVRTNKEQPKERQAGHHDDDQRGAGKGYGTHNYEPGDKIKFKAGDFEGTGEIIGKPGKDGAHVRDESGRVHQVHWSEVTGHHRNGVKPEVKPEARAPQDPVHPDKFAATDYAKAHDQSDVSPEHILAHFPEDTASKIKAAQERLASVEQTIAKHRVAGEGASAVYSPERAKVHRAVLTEPWKDKDGVEHPPIMSAERIKAAMPPEGEAPTFTILGGRGGSGKSSFKGMVYDPQKTIVLDADAIKERLPEYEGWNAAEVHEESSDILESALAMLRDAGVNVVLDATMKTAKGAIQKVQSFKDAGYRTEAHYMHLPRQEAAKRAVARFLGKTQRYVPVEVVLSNTTNEHSFDQVRSMVDKWSFRDNNVPQGQKPILISESGGDDKKRAGEALTKSEPVHIILMRGAKNE